MSVVIAEEHEEKGDQAWAKGINGQRPTVHLNTENVDELHKNMKKGAHIITTQKQPIGEPNGLSLKTLTII